MRTIFNKIRIELSKCHIDSVADETGVHRYSLYDWINGNVPHPRIDTLTKVAKALGYDIVLVRRKT